MHLGGGEGIRKGDDDKVPDTLTDWQEAEARYLSSSGALLSGIRNLLLASWREEDEDESE